MMQLEFQNVRYRRKEVHNFSSLKKYLTSRWPTIIHISAHGDTLKRHGRRGMDTAFVVGGWGVMAKHIDDMKGRISAEVIFLNACSTSFQDMAQAFISKGAHHFCAPKVDIYWVDGAVYAASFYRNYIWNGKDLERAGWFAGKQTGLMGEYPDWWSL